MLAAALAVSGVDNPARVFRSSQGSILWLDSFAASLASEQLPAAVSSAAYNANNQLTQWGTQAMTYDANGNTLFDGMNSYAWDARNRLASANNGTFSYDALGRRVSKALLSSSTGFLYDGVNPVQELNGSTVTANMLTGGVDEFFARTDANGTVNYLTDALGSTMALADTNGNSDVQYSYGPYGSLSITGSTTNSHDYIGRESDGLGIDYYRARYYNPTTGRFISEDPFGLTDQTNSNFLWNWLTGYLPSTMYYTGNNIETMEMANSPGVDRLRQFFYNKNCQNVTNYGYGTPSAAWDTLLNPYTADWSSTAAQVGGWGPASATNNGNGTVTYQIYNKAGTNSFFYHLVPDLTAPIGPMTNVEQIFTWTETIPTSGRKCGCH